MKALHLLPLAAVAAGSLATAQGLRPEVQASSGTVTTSVQGFAGWQIASPKQSLPASGSLVATARLVYAIWVDRDANGDDVIRFARSVDGGYSYDLAGAQDLWVADLAGGETFDTAGLDLKADGNHVFVVLTADRDAAGTPNAGNDDSCWILGSNDQGATWQALNASPALITPLPNGVDFNDIDDPRLAVDGSGRAHVTYEADYDDTGAGVTDSSEDLYYQRFEFVGGVLTASFPNEVKIETTAEGATDTDQPSIAADGDVVVVAWHDARDNGNGDSDDTRSRVSTDGGATWGVDYNHTNHIGDQSEDPCRPIVRGNTIVVFQEDSRRPDNVDEIFASISTDAGLNWTDGVLISQGPSTVDVDSYNVLFTDSGDILCAYHDDRQGPGNVDNDVYVVIDRNGGQDFINGTATETLISTGSDNDSMYEIDASGDVYAICYESSSFPEGGTVAVSVDRGATWTNYTVADNGVADVDDIYVAVTVNGDVNVIWQDDDNQGNDFNNVYLRGLKAHQLIDDTAAGAGIRYAGGTGAANELVLLVPSATAPASNGTAVTGALDGVAYNFTLDVLSVGAVENIGAFLVAADIDGNASWALPNLAQLAGQPIYYVAVNAGGMPPLLERQYTDPLQQNN